MRTTTRYGLRTFSLGESHIWNYVLNDNGDIAHIDINEFKAFLNTRKGPDILQYKIHLLWWLPILRVVLFWGLSCIGYLYWYLLQVYMHFYPMIVCLVIALYLFAPHSRVLAFWLMLFVSHTISNKVYIISSYLFTHSHGKESVV